ncbi:MAG: Nif3-like dinuclear metal center hexameric protein [Zoogloeaceae bacterium]|jgi:dinuclear metal center YbgI/SA1388 family protein|nr:Nif3-like dinuclear metal center hexameric protein [Zoogloeaceae bacterium]
MDREQLERFLDETLESAKFGDYSPNGLQVEGRSRVRRVITGVTACQALLDEAVCRNADTVIVHHGYFWKGESPRVAGAKRQRLATLLRHDINLFAYHLPLDAHPVLGNNAQWARCLDWDCQGHFGDQAIGCWGALPVPMRADALAGQLESVLARPPLLVGAPDRMLRRIAWCSGGAQNLIESAARLGVDAYLSGEISEPTPHLARENGIVFLACGHHATERFGPRALAAHLAETLGLDCEFVDLPNPA